MWIDENRVQITIGQLIVTSARPLGVWWLGIGLSFLLILEAPWHEPKLSEKWKLSLGFGWSIQMRWHNWKPLPSRVVSAA